MVRVERCLLWTAALFLFGISIVVNIVSDSLRESRKETTAVKAELEAERKLSAAWEGNAKRLMVLTDEQNRKLDDRDVALAIIRGNLKAMSRTMDDAIQETNRRREALRILRRHWDTADPVIPWWSWLMGFQNPWLGGSGRIDLLMPEADADRLERFLKTLGERP